ncbi:MAG TPA: hypothetical protein VL461_14455 [Dictyobacter sp.]|jgi:hypothetical protein|nr:hypothetical protein [Dictyobacter sp.]
MNKTIHAPESLDNTTQEQGEIASQYQANSLWGKLSNIRNHPLWKPYLNILGLFLVTRLAFILITYVGLTLFNHYLHGPTTLKGTSFQFYVDSWIQWDAKSYIRIAHFGYSQVSSDVAFFPVYPAAIRVLELVLGTYVGSGMLITNVTFLGSLFIIYHLALDTTGNQQIANRSLIYLSIFPTAFYTFTTYNESTFIFFTAGMFLAINRRKWWLAGLLGAIASATRTDGVLLALPYLWEWWIKRDKSTALITKASILRLLPICIIPVGLILYCIYDWHVTGNPLEFAKVQAQWGRHTTAPWVGIVNALDEIFVKQPFGSFYEIHDLLDLSMTIGFIVLTVLGWRSLPKSYSIWSISIFLLVLMAPSVVMDPLVSNQRFVLELFPAFITLAILSNKSPRLHQTIMIIFPCLLTVLTLVFISTYWMV